MLSKASESATVPTKTLSSAPAAKALARIARRLKHDNAQPTTPIHTIQNRHPSVNKPTPAKSTCVTNAIQHAAKVHKPHTGILANEVTARSLRPGGAAALLCANVGTEAIVLLGRWKSDAMFRCLRVQATTSAHSQLMLDARNFTFMPSVFERAGLPNKTPLEVAQLAAAEDLCD